MTGIRWDQAALAALAASDEMRDLLDEVAATVRDTARSNAAAYYPASPRVRAIITRSGSDEQGAWADVGYDADSPGFVLFFSEVGTVHMAPRPHLRAAVEQTRI
jgi:HK97 gp10 family phage protein